MPGSPAEVPEQDEGGGPQGSSDQVEEEESPVVHLGHARQARDHDPQPSGESAEDDGVRTPSLQVLLGSVEVLVDVAPDDRELPDGAPEDRPTPLPADHISRRVSDHCPEDGRRERGAEGDPSLVGEHSPQQDGNLPREDEPDERRRLQGGQREDEGQGRPAVQMKDRIGDAGDQRTKVHTFLRSPRRPEARSRRSIVSGSPLQ